MNRNRNVAAALAAALSLGHSVWADVQSTGFEDYALGVLGTTNNAYLGGDGRVAGANDNRWWTPSNSVTEGEIVTGAGKVHSGSKSLAVQRRTNNNDGVIVGIASPRLAVAAGEATSPVNATNTRFRFSYWFRTAPTTPVPDYRFGAESWGPITNPAPGSDRYTWHRFIADGSGNLEFFSVGMVNNPDLGYFPAADTLIATNLTWGAWYKVETTIAFVDGGDDNDIVTTNLYDASGALIGTGVDATWETGFRYALFYPTEIFPVDSVNFVTRANPLTGDIAYVDEFSTASLPPVDVELNVANSCTSSSSIDVTIDLANGTGAGVSGGQVFLSYDNTRLQFTGATASANFPTEILESFNAGAGTIDYSAGVGFGSPEFTGSGTVATLHFTRLLETCASEDRRLVYFRPRGPLEIPSRLTDGLGAQVASVTSDLSPFTMDATAPGITAPADMTVNADAGGCTATLDFNNPFDVSPVLSPTPTAGVWYTDRYAPAGFATETYLGDNRLKHSISSADSAANRPPAFASTFYNTQGRSYDVDLGVGTELAIDLYIPADWATDARRADIWGVARDISNSISAYTIIGFICNDPADALNPNPANPTPRYRIWDNTIGDWIDLPDAVTYNAWHRLSIEITATSFVYRIDGVTVLTQPNLGSIRHSSTLVQAYNFGESYDVYWDNLNFGPASAVATDNCGVTVTYVRSDNAMLTLADPFPTGTTTVTWTATDCAGNSSSDAQTVTVLGQSVFEVDVELQGVAAGPFTRCIRFEFFNAGSCPNAAATVDAVLTFSGGTASASLIVPCGDYTSISAKDPRHTLRRVAALASNGVVYSADFTGASNLAGGNLNNDAYVDVLDFGAFAGQFGVNYGTANTTCATPYPHADINGDGAVGIQDYSFIQTNFLDFGDVTLCGGYIQIPPNTPGGPVTDITVTQLVADGLFESARADLNLDDRVNQQDIIFVITNGMPTCPADFNGVGGTTVQDLFDFLNAYFSQHPRADVNRSGMLTVQDIFTFLANYFTGC